MYIYYNNNVQCKYNNMRKIKIKINVLFLTILIIAITFSVMYCYVTLIWPI